MQNPLQTEKLEQLYQSKLSETLLAFERIGMDPNNFHLRAIAHRVADGVVKQVAHESSAMRQHS